MIIDRALKAVDFELLIKFVRLLFEQIELTLVELLVELLVEPLVEPLVELAVELVVVQLAELFVEFRLDVEPVLDAFAFAFKFADLIEFRLPFAFTLPDELTATVRIELEEWFADDDV